MIRRWEAMMRWRYDDNIMMTWRYDDMTIWWHDDMIWWYEDKMIRWCDDTMIRWYGATMWWCCDMMIWWYDGLTIWWYDGAMIWWYDGLMMISVCLTPGCRKMLGALFRAIEQNRHGHMDHRLTRQGCSLLFESVACSLCSFIQRFVQVHAWFKGSNAWALECSITRAQGT